MVSAKKALGQLIWARINSDLTDGKEAAGHVA